MGSVWKTFWICFGSLGSLVGLYVGCKTVDYEWAFWVTVGGAIVLALAWTLGPNVLTWAERIRDYPILLQRSGEIQSENDDLKHRQAQLEASVESRYAAGVAEGIAQLQGGVKAAMADCVPRLVGAEASDGQVYLLAEVTAPITVGARYFMESTASGVSKGVVEVTEYDDAKHVVTLVCVQQEAPRYWEQLAERAEGDPSAPTGMHLVPFTLGPRRELATATATQDEDLSATEASD